MTKTYLQVPFAEKDEAKALGARWDPTKKRWYVQDKDLAPFARWHSEGGGTATATATAGPAKAPRTGPARLQPHCGCDVLPWEACVHSPS